MTSSFIFDGSKSFSDNFDDFLNALETSDAEMANILRVNKDVLATIVREGERDPKARAEFNTAIMTALDAFVAPDPKQDGD